jgi:hypothetical protein
MKFACRMKPPFGCFTVGKEYLCDVRESFITILDNEGVKVCMEEWLFTLSFRRLSV